MRRVFYVLTEGMRVRAAVGHARAPAAVAEGDRMIDVSRRAAEAGVRRGMRLRHARRVCRGLRICTPEAGARSLRELAEGLRAAAYGLAPRVEPDGPAALYGVVHLTPRYRRQDFLADLAGLAGVACPRLADRLAVGVAGSRFAARVAGGLAAEGRATSGIEARRMAGGRLRLLPVPAGAPAGEGAWLAPLPVDSLWPLAPAVRRRLMGLGLRTLGDVARAGRRALAAELGAEGARAWELARGVDRSPVRALYPPRELAAVRRPAGGLGTPAQVEAAAVRAAGELAAALSRRGEGARELWLLLEGGSAVAARREFPAPVARVETVRETARALAVRVLHRLGDALPLAGLRLVARAPAPLPVVQQSLWVRQRASERAPRERADELLRHLQRRFSAEKVHFGQHVRVPRRERMLAFWDPYRFARRGDDRR